jgi:hypothetical protein
MKKSISLIAAMMLILSVSACSTNRTTKQGTTGNTGTSQGLNSGTSTNTGTGQGLNSGNDNNTGISTNPSTVNRNPSINQGTSQNLNSATNNSKINPNSLTTIYKDGVFTGESRVIAGKIHSAVVTISGGKITSVSLSIAKSAAGSTTSSSGTGTMGTSLDKIRKSLISHIITHQNTDVKITAASKYKSDVNAWKTAVANALKSARM